MKMKAMYEMFVKKGMEQDPRGKAVLQKKLKEEKEKYKKMDEDDKKFYDKDKLWNPYSDTRMLNGSGNEEIKTILVGIDMEAPELLLADRLNEKGKKIDLVISHHPEGKALMNLTGVMDMHDELMHKFGVPINQAEKVMAPRREEVKRGIHGINHTRAEEAAKLLGIPFMCTHTVADNHVHQFLTKFFEKEKPEKLKDIVKAVKKLPEYQWACHNGAGPNIILGNPESRAGKIYLEMTGGTGGSDKNYEQLAKAGIGTIVAMHLSDKNRKEAEKNNLNAVIIGHMASDSLGLNLLFDHLKEKVKIMDCSGFKRVSRVSGKSSSKKSKSGKAKLKSKKKK